ncbi:geminivirus Rep-interacting motor protein-like protein [Corchorus olitorius]|uniref:Geminivirus Rep-interacting motor protein-like protein n=1 Tax=Corchorus olitorius TaxID=93759 RepID=A0A1R3KX09_9ROSI|nr:geminivirus Rep-interacting motor protein-like protein [Corchorus olitorius]
MANTRSPRFNSQHTERHMIWSPLRSVHVTHSNRLHSVSIITTQRHLKHSVLCLLAMAIKHCVRAYASYMKGNLLFEQDKNWDTALRNFKSVRKWPFFKTLGYVSGEEMAQFTWLVLSNLDIAGTLATEEADDAAQVAKLHSALESVDHKR